MATTGTNVRGARPAPDIAIAGGALLAGCGYVLPWFRLGGGYAWSFSGWAYASLSTGGGWTLWTFGWLVLALVASVWARASIVAAMTAVVGAVAGLLFAVAVVAVSFAEFRAQGSLNWVGEIPAGPGLPVMAAGFGVLFAGGVRAVARLSALASADHRRRDDSGSGSPAPTQR